MKSLQANQILPDRVTAAGTSVSGQVRAVLHHLPRRDTLWSPQGAGEVKAPCSVPGSSKAAWSLAPDSQAYKLCFPSWTH